MNVDYKRRIAVMQSQQIQPHRRVPLSATNNVQQPPQPQPQAPPKPPLKSTSPPLPRQNSKTAPPTPPKVIVDRHNRFQFTRVGFLGEGGFARVFEVQDPRETRLACKVITKTSLKTKKAKTKVSIVSLHMECKLFHVLDSFGQKSRSIVLSSILTSFASTIALRMGTTCT